MQKKNRVSLGHDVHSFFCYMKMTERKDITKLIHRKDEKELYEIIKVCLNYDVCGNISYKDRFVHYPFIQSAQLVKFSSTLCDACYLGWKESKQVDGSSILDELDILFKNIKEE